MKRPAYTHPLYRTWAGMHNRCKSPRNQKYHRYGGRGIKVCEAWSDFWVFVADVGKKPSSKHTIDRIDNDGDYSPPNVRWALPKEQARNSSTVRLIPYEGEMLPIVVVSERCGISRRNITNRIDLLGWSADEAVSVPAREGWRHRNSQRPRNHRNATKTHCVRGHPFSGENLKIKKDGSRVCVACSRIHYKTWRDR